MSSSTDHHSPTFYNPDFGDFKVFYITIAVITTVATIIFLLNVALGCCSQYSEYWNNKHTGNRWIISLWTATPHNQTALDYKELEDYPVPQVVIYDPEKHPYEYSNVEFQTHPTEIEVQPEVVPAQYFELVKRESDI